MRNGSRHSAPRPRLLALGSASLDLGDAEQHPLRSKDLALLYFLTLGGDRPHSKSYLAGLLWGDTAERNARHSLNQALARIRSVFETESVWAMKDQVQW